MSTRDEIQRLIQEYVTVEMLEGEAEGLTPATNLLALGILDSLGVVMLRLFVEDTFQVRLPEGNESRDLATIATLAEVVDRLKRESA